LDWRGNDEQEGDGEQAFHATGTVPWKMAEGKRIRMA
jgi:hypothetical protein